MRLRADPQKAVCRSIANSNRNIPLSFVTYPRADKTPRTNESAAVLDDEGGQCPGFRLRWPVLG